MINKINSKIFRKKSKIIFVGAMGSGKTEIAINYAANLGRSIGKEIGLIDFDMVKPYFKIRNIKNRINNNNIQLIIPDIRYRYADTPIISAAMESYIIDPNRTAVIDVGGDEVGARLLGRYHNRINIDDLEFWYVYNGMRPLSRGANDVLEIMNSIETASRIKLTGLVHNSHLMHETTIDTLKDNEERAIDFAKAKDIPVVFQSIREDLYEEASKLSRKIPILPLTLHVSMEWD